MKKRILTILLLGAVLMTAACSKPVENVAAETAPTPEAEKAVEAFGIIEASEIENISLDINAVVEKVNVKEGQQVKKGDVILSLDMKEYMDKIQSRQHELNIARLEGKKIATEKPNPDIEKLVNDLNYANEQLLKAEKELESQEKLFKTGAISKNQYDEHVKAVDEKRKAAEDIKYNLDSVMHSNGLGADIQSERAASIENEIRQMKDKLNRSYISENNVICTMDNGIVYELGYKAGDSINYEKKLLSLMNLDTLVVKANVAEEFIKDVKPGARVEIIPVADKSRTYNGKVSTLAKKATVQNGETVIPVEISIDDKDDFLLPNFNVDVKIYME